MEPLGTATWPVQPRGSGRVLREVAEIQSSAGFAQSPSRPNPTARNLRGTTRFAGRLARRRTGSPGRQVVQAFFGNDCLRRRRAGENVSGCKSDSYRHRTFLRNRQDLTDRINRRAHGVCQTATEENKGNKVFVNFVSFCSILVRLELRKSSFFLLTSLDIVRG